MANKESFMVESNTRVNPQVSIIVPVYNTGTYLKKCIDSIIAQTYASFELIIVDDGSTDASPQICDDYAKQDKRVKVIHKKNGGLSDARNVGINNSIGEYILFIDSDDWISANMIEELYNNSRKYDADMVISNYLCVNESGNDEGYYKLYIDFMVISGREAISKLYDPNQVYYIIMCAKLIKRKLFDNLRFRVGTVNEDELLTHHLLDKCNKIVCLPQRHYYYYQRPNSIMHTKDISHVFRRVKIQNERLKFIYDNNICEIRDKAHIYYWNTLINSYHELYKSLPRPKAYLLQMKREYNKIIIKMILNKSVCWKIRLLHLIFYISPLLFLKLEAELNERGEKVRI
jgi:glycosyltransferase involved in cell wall biosynthesis